MKNFKLILLPLLIIIAPHFSVSANEVKIPVLSEINSSLKSFEEPFISGFTEKNTKVLVYIDGNYLLDAEIVEAEKVNNFYVFLKQLPSEGMHSVFLIARDQNGVMSPQTEQFSFYINHQLTSPKNVETSFVDQSFVFGESQNENYIDIYIDNVINETIYIPKNSDGSFKYSNLNLSKGVHEMFFVVRDAVGRESQPSKKISFNFEGIAPLKEQPVVKPITINKDSKISNNAVTEDVLVEGVDNIYVDPTTKTNEEEVDEILEELGNEENNKDGSLDESGDKQSNLKWNLLIFLLFVVAVVFWIIWVNKENDIEIEENSKNNKNK